MATGVKLVTSMLIYYSMMFIIFANLPPAMAGDVVFSGGFINESQAQIDTGSIVSQDSAIASSTSIVDIFWSMLTFDVNGVGTTLRFIFATIPLLVLALGIYAIIRGI